MCVRVGNSLSKLFDVTSGIPQGSILGPFLFKFHLFSSPMFKVAQLLKLADDCKLYVAFNKNDHQIINDMKDDIASYHKWITGDLKMKLNHGKTVVIHLGHDNPRHEYHIGDTIIKSVEQFDTLLTLFLSGSKARTILSVSES